MVRADMAGQRKPRARPTSAPAAVAPSPLPLTPAKRRLFAALLLACPGLLLLALELILRLVGFGYDTDFFRPQTLNGRNVWVENRDFGKRFFPASMVRTPLPMVVERVKPAGVCRILVLGESAALGDPETAFSFSRMLEVLLAQQFPGRRFEVINTGMTAINSHVIRAIAGEAHKLQADYWLVYAGNNEVVGPYGPGTVFGTTTLPLWAIRAQLAAREWRVVQGLEQLRQRWLSPAVPPAWEGMEMFLDRRVPAERPAPLPLT